MSVPHEGHGHDARGGAHDAGDAGRDAPGAHRLALARTLRQVLERDFALDARDRIVVGIAGESGSGKSVTAMALADELTREGTRALVLHQDDYFLRPPRANHEHRVRDVSSVGPGEVDLARLAAHVADFRAGRAHVAVPATDRANDRFVTRTADFHRARALVVEGTYVLALADLDVRVFLAATYEDTRERRRARARDVDSPFVESVLALEHRLIAPFADRADVLVGADFTVRLASL